MLERTTHADSLLRSHLNLLRQQSLALSTDTLLATDSLLRTHYATLKEFTGQVENKQAELRTWREHLILLPPINDIAQGVTNPFGEQAGDDGALVKLNAYSDTLTTIETSISTLIRTTTYERTSTPQSQE